MSAWDAGFDEYVSSSYEVRFHRRTRTFGGMLWPENPAERLLEIALSVLDKKE